jgi:hypothetical protein
MACAPFAQQPLPVALTFPLRLVAGLYKEDLVVKTATTGVPSFTFQSSRMCRSSLIDGWPILHHQVFQLHYLLRYHHGAVLGFMVAGASGNLQSPRYCLV